MISRFSHVLVPLDFKPRNQHALEIAFEIAEVNHARVTLLHVVERLGEGAEDSEIAEFYERLCTRADAELESRSQRFSDAGLDVARKVLLGKSVHEIVRYAAGHDVDLMILSSHPLDAAHPAQSLATVSYQAAVLSPCPVLLAKEPAEASDA